MMNVLIVEDSEATRESLRSLLSDLHNINIVGYAADEAGAIEHIDTLLPDAVILDIGLQTGSGVTVLKYIKKHHAGIKVIVLTNYANKFYMAACKRAHADCFLDKSFQFTEVRGVILEWSHHGHPSPRGTHHAE